MKIHEANGHKFVWSRKIGSMNFYACRKCWNEVRTSPAAPSIAQHVETYPCRFTDEEHRRRLRTFKN